MKAVRIHGFGDEDVLRHEDVLDSVPAAEEALVTVRATGINHVDLDIRAGISRMDLDLPAILGLEFAGEISWLPDGAPSALAVGDPVAVSYTLPCWSCEYCRTGRDNVCENRQLFGVTRPGGYAEMVAVPLAALIPLPGALTASDAAAVQVAFSTAWHVLMTRGGLTSDQTVLIHAAGSGVGSAALQVASLAGARIIATASTREKLDLAAEYADETVNYTEAGWPERVRELTAGKGVDVVLSHVGGDELKNSFEAVRDDGIIVLVGGHSGEVVPLDIIPFFRREIRLVGSSRATRHEIETVFELAAMGKLRPVVHGVFALAEASAAHSELSSRRVFGKVLLTP